MIELGMTLERLREANEAGEVNNRIILSAALPEVFESTISTELVPPPTAHELLTWRALAGSGAP